jgi:putative CocE/NonD family hydrolase
MRKFVEMLICLSLIISGTGHATDIRLPTALEPESVDLAVPMIADQLVLEHRDDNRQDYLDTLFRLQLAGGHYREAIASIRSLRELRNDDPSLPPIYLQYEIYALARVIKESRSIEFPDAWRAAFDQRFGALSDAAAQRVTPSFEADVVRIDRDFAKALADSTGKISLGADQAQALVRSWQVKTAYNAFHDLAPGAIASDDRRRYIIDRNVRVRTPDGATVSALIVRPRNDTPLPALLTFTIYANDDWAWDDAKKAAAHGYAAVVAYTRGKGRSTATIAPYEHDGADAAAVIDWVDRQPWSDGQVGMYGGSYSGFTQWAALKHRPNALKAIATSATTAPGIDVPMEGGVFLNFMYPWPFYVAGNRTLDEATYNDQNRWSSLNRKWYESGRSYRAMPQLDATPNPIFERWLDHPAYDSYWQAMIPQGAEYASIDIPVLATTGYFDGAQIGVLHYFREHLQHRPAANHTLLIGPYGHLAMQKGPESVVYGYELDPSARIDLQALRFEWFDHVLKGAPRPALLAGRVNWQVMGANVWRHAATLEEMSTRSQRLYLVPGRTPGTHVLSPRAQPKDSVLQRVDFSDRSDGAGRAVPYQSVVHEALDKQTGLSFVSKPLPRETEMAGEFGGVLDFTINKHDVDIAIGVYELNARGEYLDLAWWLQRASYGADRSSRGPLQPHSRQQLEVDNTRLIGRRLAAGSRLVVTLGVVKQPDRQLNLGSGKEPSEESIHDAGEPLEILWHGNSYLEFGVH